MFGVNGKAKVAQVAQAKVSEPPSETAPPPVIGPAVLRVTEEYCSCGLPIVELAMT